MVGCDDCQDSALASLRALPVQHHDVTGVDLVAEQQQHRFSFESLDLGIDAAQRSVLRANDNAHTLSTAGVRQRRPGDPCPTSHFASPVFILSGGQHRRIAERTARCRAGRILGEGKRRGLARGGSVTVTPNRAVARQLLRTPSLLRAVEDLQIRSERSEFGFVIT